ncbi:DUF3017 domain-containing protein [Streptomyces sp. NRRL S-646]|uniref:DUF3017 domain-containing protein n=1 Tax=Streptomyces sp. NRRL S-646 TaxID=1463917 RepID=UPI0004CC8A9A|nr:DUF3017 domain-containing protein [Streptomyces sp. NRRL S-646]
MPAEAKHPEGAAKRPERAVDDPEQQAEETVRDAISAPDAEGRPRRTTRRFPLFTKDTARPEGGGRAASGDAPPPARQWPMLLVLGVAAVGLAVVATDAFRYALRVGCLVFAGALLLGAVLRWALPRVGMLAVRSRFTDIVTYGGMGVGIAVLALAVHPDPVIRLQFVQNVLHFTLT